MFKKFKDKLAEEVKSSPQRLHQFAQAAQAAVTSASSSISDITNNDLFSIGDNDASNKSQTPQINQANAYPGASHTKHETMQVGLEAVDYTNNESQRLRRLSNSSFSSDISFRLPSYESPSMYHLQSDMEVSASEAEEKSPFGGMVNLDRVTKEQLYAAYRRTQDRCSKYKSQYSDLARHYKLLERENAKAKNVLVETQDKALRRISELREQCSLEQSAKAHLEQVLRTEIEEKNMKIESLYTNLKHLQVSSNTQVISMDTNTQQNVETNFKPNVETNIKENVEIKEALDESLNTNTDVFLINFDSTKDYPEALPTEVSVLNNKIEKLEHLVNKYKESLKVTKEKNSQLSTEVKKVTIELENKTKENENLKTVADSLNEAKNKIEELNDNIEELNNKNNSLEFSKNKEISILDIKLNNAQDEITKLNQKIEVLSKREEEYAISLAENKLSIHKELESKESEIKTLKDSLASSHNEIKSLQNTISDHKNKIEEMKEDQTNLKNNLNELDMTKDKITKYERQLEATNEKCKSLENANNKLEEEYKCLQLQLKQEGAEKLAMIDRNTYLENRNAQLLDEISKKNVTIKAFESDIEKMKNDKELHCDEFTTNESELTKLKEELIMWRTKCSELESEIQDERIELEKLQAEIEKLLLNYEHVQKENQEINAIIEDLRSQNSLLKNEIKQLETLKYDFNTLKSKVVGLRQLLIYSSEEINSFKVLAVNDFSQFKKQINFINRLYTEEQKSNSSIINNILNDKRALEKELESKLHDDSNTLGELNMIKKENENLMSIIAQSNSNNSKTLQEIKALREEKRLSICELNNLRDETDKLKSNIKEAQKNTLMVSEKLSGAEQRILELMKSLQDVNKEKEKLQENIETKNDLLNDAESRLTSLNIKYEELLEIKKERDEKSVYIHNLEKDVKNLKEENLLLRKSSDKISQSLIDIELEVKEVKASHSKIEQEKDNLSSIIENLDRNSKKLVEHKETQSDFPDITELKQKNSLHSDTLNHNIDKKESSTIEMHSLLETNEELSTKECFEENFSLLKERDLKSDALLDECELLKVENKRLRSDIEGLQIYMTKVSKENDELNNKMRELIASSENIVEKRDIGCSKDESQSNKDRIENLLRENCLLVEENLELKDQLQSQNNNRYSSNDHKQDSKDIANMEDEYKKILETKKDLETRLKDIEDMNYTVNKDMFKMQENNKKLKLSNEKLERKLDEALVSLRHLHSLQENTELEYLKNILFEYLTGSGTHSYTLAKVLSAVVKFDDKQTDTVLQKEKERQGLLRQLGLI